MSSYGSHGNIINLYLQASKWDPLTLKCWSLCVILFKITLISSYCLLSEINTVFK